MRRTALILLALLLLLCPLYAGCSISAKTTEHASPPSESVASSEPENESESAKDAEPAPESVSSSEATPADPEPEPEPVKREHIDLATADITHGGNFCQELAWIKYKLPGDNLTTITALVDRSGSVMYKTTETVLYAAPVSDGYTFLRIRVQQTGSGSRLDENDYCEIVLDAEGTEYFRTEQKESSTGYLGDHIICSGGGKFVVLRHTEDISGSYYSFGTMDAYGNIIDDFTVSSFYDRNLTSVALNSGKLWAEGFASEAFYDGYELTKHISYYIGDGVYRLFETWNGAYSYFYIPSEGKLVSGEKMNGPVTDGRLLNLNSNSWGIRDVTAVDFDAMVERGARVRDDEDFFYSVSNGDQRYKADFFAPFCVENSLFYIDHCFMNVYGERIIELNLYPENELWCSPFHDGHALLIIHGGDGSYYATVIDEDQNELFPPFRISYDYNDFYEIRNFSCGIGGGYFAAVSPDGVLGLYDLSGNLVKSLGEKTRVFSITDEYLAYGGSSQVKYLFFDSLA